jgi:ATP-binding cassette subfamily C exporter for protease/lipase/ATP-binding cassette subfamily C protein EexD
VKPLWDGLRPLLGSLALFSLVMNLLFVAPALFMLQVFDRVIPSNSRETLLVLLVGAGVALMILALLDYVRARLQHVAGALVEERLSSSVVRAIVARAARPPQAVGVEGVRDVAALRTVFSANGLIALLDAPWVVVYVAVIWAFHPSLGWAAMAAAVVMLLLAWLNDRLGRRTLEDLQRQGRRATQYVEGSLRNAEVLQALGMTPGLLARWNALQEELALTQTRASRSGVAFSVLTRFVRQAVQVLILALGAYLVLAQEASPGVMVATTVLLGRAIQPVEQLVSTWRLLTDARLAYRRLRDLFGDLGPAAAPMTIPRPEGRLSVEGLSYRARAVGPPVLAGIAFSLRPGEALAVIGPSAAGKSTLARLLIGVWAPSAGTVRLDGADVAAWPREELGRWIGYVPQDVELFDGTVADNIARLGPVDPQAVVAAATRAHAHEMILSLPQGYDTPLGERGGRLSPGQRQRIALARALYGDPRLVVLDEPNSNLDGPGEIALAATLADLRRAGVTSVLVTHRPALVSHVDRILVLRGGRVQHFGPAHQVLQALSRPARRRADERVA